MNLKVGDSVLYLSQKQQHTGIITAIDKDNTDFITEIDPDTNTLYRYAVHWINDQDTVENLDDIIEYRKQYLEMLGK